MKKQYYLFVDESGVANPKDTQSTHAVLCGCAIEESERHKIKQRAEQLKFKYWGWEGSNIVFHSREMGRTEGAFEIFKDHPELFNQFQADLFRFLAEGNFFLFFVLVDKDKARNLGWNDVKVYREMSTSIVKVFLLFLSGLKAQGRLVIELSTSEKDVYFHEALNYFLSSGIPEVNIDYLTAQNTLTSVSFVTKHNHDIEEQICDLFAYPALVKHLNTKKTGSYEEAMIKLLERKIYKIPIGAKLTKLKFYQQISPFRVLPAV